MNASLNSPDVRRSAAEGALLSALCQGLIGTRALETIMRRLTRHRFSVPEHEAIFQAASRLAAAAPGNSAEARGETVRRELMASLTRMGFPDTDLAPFFGAASPAEADLPSLFSDL